jgi:hypothetical protein
MSSVEQRVQEFFALLEKALGGPHEQSDAVQAELRADLEAQVGDAVAAGADRELAWSQALEALGEPDALARSMRGALPPSMPRDWARNLRIIGAGLVAAWTLSILFSIRSWDYGVDLRTTSIVLGTHLPLVLLLWPGVAWRWNPLFYTGSSLTFGFLLVLLDVWARNTTIKHNLGAEVGLMTEAGAEVGSALPVAPTWSLFDLVPFAFAGLIVLTFWMIQRRRQRWLALAWTLALLAPVEAVHQVEEGFFRAEAQHAVAWVEARLQESGSLPTSEEFKQNYEPRWLSRLHYYPTDGTDPGGSPSWALHWSRATQHSSELGYHSDGRIWGND